MTTTDPLRRDELASAYLDDEATLEERAQVESDADLLELVEAMRLASAQVAAPVRPDARRREQHLAAALAASGTAANVTSMASRRRQWTPDLTRIAAAAAAILLILIAAPLLLLKGGDDSDQSAAVDTAAPESARIELGNDSADDGASLSAEAADTGSTADSPDALPPSGGESGIADDEPTSESPAALNRRNLGEVKTLGELIALASPQAIQTDVPEEPDNDASPELGCIFTAVDEAAAPGSQMLLVGTAVLDGRPVEYATVSGPDGDRIIVVAATSCTTLADAELSG